MSDPIEPAQSAVERRRSARRRADPPPPPLVEGERANLPAVTAAAPSPRPEPRREGPAMFAAQVIGQEGQKRGLRGGSPVLNQARSTYLGNEFSGPRDRRPPSGALTKTEI